MIAASGSTQTAQLPAIQIYLNNSPITTSARGHTDEWYRDALTGLEC